MWGSAQLDLDHRREAWRLLMNRHFDIVVIGGGVTGAGVALDAVTRGLSVALVEARDFASGTSSRSSKLFHGGVRYLEQLEFGLVREALQERDLMVSRLAPHLVKPVPIIYPLTRYAWERPYVGAGLLLYDVIARVGGSAGREMPLHRHLSRTRARQLAPSLRRDALVGGLLFWDAQTDDARHTLTLVRTAAHYGAVVRSSTQAVRIVRDAGHAIGVEVRDVETGETAMIRGAVTVSCAGVWTDDIEELAGTRGRFQVRASKGVHIVVPRDRIASETALILRTEKSVLFVLPWGNHWIIGTTDTDWRLDRSHPAASRADIDYLLAHVNTVLRTPLSHEDIEGVYAGLRPLLAGESDETSQLSREHAVARALPGLVSVAGGKYTTYRIMARDAVDVASADLDGVVPPSVTERVPLLGAEGYHALVNQVAELSETYGLPAWRIRRLLGRYGSLVHSVLKPAGRDPSLLEPVQAGDEYLRAEARYAVTHEGALHLDDVLARRTRLSIETAHRGVECAEEVAELVAEPLGWSAADVKTEVAVYAARVEAERQSQAQPDDLAADAARLVAPDARRLAASR